MIGITDVQRREVRNTARTILDKRYDHSTQAWELASFILATVDAPAPTLAEELRHIAEHWEEWATETITSAIRAAADRAEQTEQERDEARADVNYILATVDAPAPTLAEELARIAENSPVWTIQNVRDELKSAAARAEQMERDLEEARAARKALEEA